MILSKHKQCFLLYTAKVITVELYDRCQDSLAIFFTRLVLVVVIWMVFKELFNFCMACFNKLIICVPQSRTFQLKIVAQVVHNNVNFEWHGEAKIFHECDPCVFKVLKDFSVIADYTICS